MKKLSLVTFIILALLTILPLDVIAETEIVPFESKVRVVPGEIASLEIEVQNNSENEKEYRAEILNFDFGFLGEISVNDLIIFEESSFKIAAGEEKTIKVILDGTLENLPRANFVTPVVIKELGDPEIFYPLQVEVTISPEINFEEYFEIKNLGSVANPVFGDEFSINAEIQKIKDINNIQGKFILTNPTGDEIIVQKLVFDEDGRVVVNEKIGMDLIDAEFNNIGEFKATVLLYDSITDSAFKESEAFYVVHYSYIILAGSVPVFLISIFFLLKNASKKILKRKNL